MVSSITDNSVTLPGVDENSAYVSTTNPQYWDDAEEFLHSELLSNYGDLLVSGVVTRWFVIDEAQEG